jgi:hypothetical protein
VLSIDGQNKAQRSNQVWSFADKSIAFLKRFAHQSDFRILQIAKAAMNNACRSTGSAGSEIILFKQQDAVAGAGTLTRNGDTVDAAADHDDLEALSF